jgi:hypothetical protein
MRFRLVALMLLALFMNTINAQDIPPLAMTRGEVALYAAPGQDTLGILPGRETVIIEGRSDAGHWLLIRTLDEVQRGWVATSGVALSADVILRDLPLSSESFTAEQPANAQQHPPALPD